MIQAASRSCQSNEYCPKFVLLRLDREVTNRQAAKNAKVSMGSFGDLGVLGGLAVLVSSNAEIGHYQKSQ
jgi:hypothetical protein